MTTVTDFNSRFIQCYPMRNEDHCPTDSNSHCIRCIGKKEKKKNEDHYHTDSNSDYIQCIRGKTRTALIPILIVTVFSATRWETKTAVITILILTVFSAIR